MAEERKWKPPVFLVLLDAVGAMLVGIGAAERFAETHLVPAPLRFENYDLVMMVIGGFLMVPILFGIIGNARRKARNGI